MSGEKREGVPEQSGGLEKKCADVEEKHGRKREILEQKKMGAEELEESRVM